MVFLRSRTVTGDDLTSLSRTQELPLTSSSTQRYFYDSRLLEVEPLPEEAPTNWLDRYVVYVQGAIGFHGSGDTRFEACQEAILKLSAYIDARIKAQLPLRDQQAFDENLKEKRRSGKYEMQRYAEEGEMRGRAEWKGPGIDLPIFADVSEGAVRQAGWCDLDVDGSWYVWREPSL